jgi:hypothetical protein
MIHNQDAAIKRFIEYLNSKGLCAKVVYENSYSRHKIVKDINGKSYYCVFKREFFNTFSKYFPEVSKNYVSGLGESLNKEALDLAISNFVDEVVFIHPEKFYFIYPLLFKNFALKYNLQRVQKRENKYKKQGTIHLVREVTYVVPVELLGVYE